MAQIVQNTDGEYGKYIVQTLREPAMIPPEFRELYKKFATRILWMDADTVPGAFQMNTAWYRKPQPRDPLFEEHVHDYDELIGFFGSDPEDPYALHAVIELSLEGEAHRLDRTSLIFVPGGMKHNPLRLLEVDQPIFHFSVVMDPFYGGENAYNVGSK
ncbi:MAG: hypothetical protein LBR00_02345 [Clostridiales Family XIII bacterium]|jgi:hypothetical protein|nr:hypothetical protein [Clostridiales Family XIII bacterium]